jgi:hypothetical protein
MKAGLPGTLYSRFPATLFDEGSSLSNSFGPTEVPRTYSRRQQALANAGHGKAACATLLPKPDLPKGR